MATDVKYRPVCKIPVPHGRGPWHPCGEPAKYLVALVAQDRAMNVCEMHGQRWLRPPFSESRNVVVTEL